MLRNRLLDRDMEKAYPSYSDFSALILELQIINPIVAGLRSKQDDLEDHALLLPRAVAQHGRLLELLHQNSGSASQLVLLLLWEMR